MKILVTGGAGFIGTNFIYYMLEKYPSYSIVCYDFLTYAGNYENLKPINSNNFLFVKGDITEIDRVDALFLREKFDIVINFAAESHVDRSIKDPAIFLKTNIIGTQVLMDACRKYSVMRFHQVSTDEVYGDLPLDRPDLLFTEKIDIKPSSPYSASKASSDLLVLAYYRTYGLPITISRCSNNYGPYQSNEKLIPHMIMQAHHNKPLPVYGTGDNVRDWLHVHDHCSAIDLIIHQGNYGEIYNVGGDNEKTNLNLVKLLLNKMQKPESLISFVADRLGHDKRYAIDSSKLKNELGWIPKIHFGAGIDSTIEWYIQNKSKWLERQ